MSEKPEAVILRGNWGNFCLPKVLYHGTTRKAAQIILKEGMSYEKGRQNICSTGGNYLTVSLAMAVSYAKSRAFRQEDSPCVLGVQSQFFNPDLIGFDINLGHRHWSEAITYAETIDPEYIAEQNISYYDSDEKMLLKTPEPGIRPIVFRLEWERADEFKLALNVTENENCICMPQYSSPSLSL